MASKANQRKAANNNESYVISVMAKICKLAISMWRAAAITYQAANQ
jgi:hypothetical protein